MTHRNDPAVIEAYLGKRSDKDSVVARAQAADAMYADIEESGSQP